ncbi:hypothetical protein JXQ70_20495 [bacterium]|nr:hypothetical protein [bacterium]
MKRKKKRVNPASATFHFPVFYVQSYRERVIFSGNLTSYYHELVEKLIHSGVRTLLIDEHWEVPQLVGFDNDKEVVILALRNTAQDELGESEFLISSLNHQWIVHISAYETEDEFFDHCFQLIELNFAKLNFESFLYDEKGNYTGQLVVEEIEPGPIEDMVHLDRNITSDRVVGSEEE